MQKLLKFHILFIINAAIFACTSNEAVPPAPLTAEQKNQSLILEAASHIRTGDIVLRCGKDVTSYKIREMSVTDKTYSHAGIAVVRNDSVLIYHITPPELDEPKSDTALRLEPLQKFAKAENNFEIGIARFPLTQEQVNSLVQYCDSLYINKTSFDFLFDLKSDKKMYCSEMLDKAIGHATADSIRLKQNAFRDHGLVKKVAGYLKAEEKVVQSRMYIPIENIYLHPSCEMIKQFKFSN